MEYPVFELNESGEIVPAPTATPEPSVEPVSGDDVAASVTGDTAVSSEVASGSDTTASGNVVYVENPETSEAVSVLSDSIATLQSDVTYLANAQASTAGYLSSTALDTFDRVLQQYDFDYYCAFRNGTDSYNSVLYLSDRMELEGDTLILYDVTQVQLYRTSSGSSYSYEYYYSVSSAGDVSVALGNDLMYYTNCAVGYPALGELPAPTKYPGWFTVMFVLLLAICFFSMRRSK